MKQPEEVKAALYMRLSKASKDPTSSTDESGSIETQRMILRAYAQEHNYQIVGEYIDDGWSGTTFERPEFQRMMDDTKDGKINCILTKDLSRFGREASQIGTYLDFTFPNMGVICIAVHEEEDTIHGLTFKGQIMNIFNETYARTTSEKVKMAFKAKYGNGERICVYAPLGYIKDPERSNHLIIDPDTKWIIEKMFDMAAHGAGAAKIQRQFVAEQVPTPSWVNFQRDGTFAHIFQGQPEAKRYQWTIAQIKQMLSDETYIGNTVHNRQGTISFKNKKSIRRPKDEWMIVEGTQEPIISKDVFDLVQQQIKRRKRPQSNEAVQIFAGLVRCADCGWSMRFATNRTAKNPYSYFSCTKYTQEGKTACSIHYIRYDVLYPYVLSRLQYWASQAQQDPEKLLQRLLKTGDKELAKTQKRAAEELRTAEKRLRVIDTRFSKLYEDYASEKVNERNYLMLSKQYQREQDELETRIAELTRQLEEERQDSNNAEKWIKLIQQYTDLEELTAEVLNTLIDKILVHEAVKNPDGTKEQEVEIFYRFVGKIDG